MTAEHFEEDAPQGPQVCLGAVCLVYQLWCEVLLRAPHLREPSVFLPLGALFHIVSVLSDTHQGGQSKVRDLHFDKRTRSLVTHAVFQI